MQVSYIALGTSVDERALTNGEKTSQTEAIEIYTLASILIGNLVSSLSVVWAVGVCDSTTSLV